MKLTQSVVLIFATVALTGCFSGAPNADTVRELIERNGMEAAKAQANTFRPKPLSDEELAKLPNEYSDINVSNCREDQSVESEYLCFVKMDVKTVMGSVSVEEDIRILEPEEGEWRLKSK